MPTCHNCNKEITKKDDANVLAFFGFVLRTFCNNCYSSKERGFWRHAFYFPKHPINSTIYKVGLWASTVIIFFMIFVMLLFIFPIDFSQELIFIILLILILAFILVWQWVLYFKAKGILALLK